MKKNILNALVALGLLATLYSCSKDEQADAKPITSASYNPLDPQQFGYINRGDGELYFYDDSLSTFSEAGKKYLLFEPLSLEKYKNGKRLDSICNKDIAVRFESYGVKTHNKSVLWNKNPRVVDEHPPVITFSTGNVMTIKFSKMVFGFGFEYNTPFKGTIYGVTTRFRNSKTNKTLSHPYTTFIRDDWSTTHPGSGVVGGAIIRAVESVTPFDEVSISFEDVTFGNPPPSGPFEISLAGFRYKLAI